MLSVFTLIVVAAALWLCPFWRRERHFAPLYLWAIYCGIVPVPIFGVGTLRFRWALGCAFGAIGLYWLWRSKHRQLDSMVVMPALLIAWALASTSYSSVPEYSFLRAIALIPMYAGAFIGVRSLLFENGGLERVTICLMVMIGVQTALICGSYFLRPEAMWNGRFQGTWRATNTGLYLAYTLPITLLLIGRTVGLKRAAWTVLSLGMLYLLVITRTRQAIFSGAIVVATAYLALIHNLRGKHLTWRVTSLGALAILAITASAETLKFFRISSPEDLLSSRVGIWEGIIDGLSESPWIGHGYGAVRYYTVDGAMTWTVESRELGQRHTHNEFISIMYDLGIVPCTLLAFFFIVVGWRGAGQLGRFRHPDRSRNPILIALFLSWCVDASDTMSHDGRMTIGNPHATWFWIKSLIVYYGALCPSEQYDDMRSEHLQ